MTTGSHTSTAAPLVLDRLFQVNMPVLDIERAVAFYRDTLGVPFFARRGNLAFFGVSGVRLLLEVVEESGGCYDHPGSILYFTVSEIRTAYDTLRSRGVEFRGAPELIRKDVQRELWMAFFSDGEGNTHAIAAEKGAA